MFKDSELQHIDYKQRVLDYADKQIEAAFLNMEAIKDSFDDEAVHDFRVAVKRMRVLMGFLSLFDENIKPDEKISNERRFFKLLSPIRDRQVQQAKLNDTAKQLKIHIPAFNRYIEKRLEKAKTNFQQHKYDFLPGMDLTMVKYPLSHILSSEMILREAENQFRIFLTKTMNDLPYFTEDDEKMHESRKELKKVVYILEMLDIQRLSIMNRAVTFKGFKKLQERLGDTHDCIVGRDMVRKFIRKKNKAGQKYLRLAEWLDRQRLLEIHGFKDEFYAIIPPGSNVTVELITEEEQE